MPSKHPILNLKSPLIGVILFFLSVSFTSAAFSEGTAVLFKGKPTPIETIKQGHGILGRHERTGKDWTYPVAKVATRVAKELILLTTKETTIRVTPDHSFWIHRKGWIRAKYIEVGDQFKRMGGHLAKVIQIGRIEGNFPVIALEIRNARTFYVSKAKILVHNEKCEVFTEGKKRRFRKRKLKSAGTYDAPSTPGSKSVTQIGKGKSSVVHRLVDGSGQKTNRLVKVGNVGAGDFLYNDALIEMGEPSLNMKYLYNSKREVVGLGVDFFEGNTLQQLGEKGLVTPAHLAATRKLFDKVDAYNKSHPKLHIADLNAGNILIRPSGAAMIIDADMRSPLGNMARPMTAMRLDNFQRRFLK